MSCIWRCGSDRAGFYSSIDLSDYFCYVRGVDSRLLRSISFMGTTPGSPYFLFIV